MAHRNGSTAKRKCASIFTLPGAAARAPNEQASDIRQSHAAPKVRTPPRQTGNPFLEAKRKNPRRSHAATNGRTTDARPARLQAAARSPFRRLPIHSPIFYWTPLRRFIEQGLIHAPNFLRQVRGGRDGCPASWRADCHAAGGRVPPGDGGQQSA